MITPIKFNSSLTDVKYFLCGRDFSVLTAPAIRAFLLKHAILWPNQTKEMSRMNEI